MKGTFGLPFTLKMSEMQFNKKSAAITDSNKSMILRFLLPRAISRTLFFLLLLSPYKQIPQKTARIRLPRGGKYLQPYSSHRQTHCPSSQL